MLEFMNATCVINSIDHSEVWCCLFKPFQAACRVDLHLISISFFLSSFCVFNLQKSYEEMFLSGKTKQNNQTKQIQNNVDCLRSEIDRNTQKVNKNAEFNGITRID